MHCEVGYHHEGQYSHSKPPPPTKSVEELHKQEREPYIVSPMTSDSGKPLIRAVPCLTLCTGDLFDQQRQHCHSPTTSPKTNTVD